MDFYSYYGASQIVVNGTMTATGDTFATLSGSGASIQVESGGHLTAANSTFNINQLSLANANVYGSGDLTGDTFNMPIYVPYGDVQYLAGNVEFEQVYINATRCPPGRRWHSTRSAPIRRACSTSSRAASRLPRGQP